MVMETDSRTEHSSHQCGSCHGTDRATGKGVIKRDASASQFLDLRGGALRIAVEAQVMFRVVLGKDPDNVRLLLCCQNVSQGGEDSESEKQESCHRIGARTKG